MFLVLFPCLIHLLIVFALFAFLLAGLFSKMKYNKWS